VSDLRDVRTRPEIDPVRVRLPYWDAYGPIVEVTFVAGASKLDVVHGLSQIPTAFHVLWADGPVYAEPGVRWTKEIAYLRATNANTHARVIFFTCRGDAREP
jgi:hypothetical protein